jgi:hypothetical protein
VDPLLRPGRDCRVLGITAERAANDSFRATMIELFRSQPAGRLALPSFAALAERVTAVDGRLDHFESAPRRTAAP